MSTHLSQGCASWQRLHLALRSPLWIDTVYVTPGGACAAWSCSSSPHLQPSNFPGVSHPFSDIQNSYIQNLSLLKHIMCSSLSPLLYPLLLIDPGWSSKTFKIKGYLWFFFFKEYLSFVLSITLTSLKPLLARGWSQMNEVSLVLWLVIRTWKSLWIKWNKQLNINSGKYLLCHIHVYMCWLEIMFSLKVHYWILSPQTLPKGF